MNHLIALLIDGEFVAHCGPDCYNNTDPAPSCICGGSNRGIGFTYAQQNTLTHVPELIERIMRLHPETEDILFHFHA